MRHTWTGVLTLGVMLAAGACSPSAAPGATAPVAAAPDAIAAPIAAPAGPIEATAVGGPKRADGFWESSWGDAKQQYCVGNGSEEKFSLVDEMSIMGECSKKDFKRIANGWEFETVCAMMNTTTTQKGTITGDFRNAYTIEQTVTQSPGSAVKGTIIAKRLGDCPAKYKPGDLVKGDLSVNMAN